MSPSNTGLRKFLGLVTEGNRSLDQRQWAFEDKSMGLWSKINLTLAKGQREFGANSTGTPRSYAQSL
jgi:hypothetical protein